MESEWRLGRLEGRGLEVGRKADQGFRPAGTAATGRYPFSLRILRSKSIRTANNSIDTSGRPVKAWLYWLLPGFTGLERVLPGFH